LGGQSCGANQPATSLTISRDGNIPLFALNGGIRMRISENILRNDLAHPPATGERPASAQVEIKACAGVVLREDRLPEFSFRTLGVRGNFLFGGGVALTNASLDLVNLENAFNPSQNLANPFAMTMGGMLLIP